MSRRPDRPVSRRHVYTPWYLIRCWRFAVFKIRNPHVVTAGMVYLDRGVEIRARRGYGRLIIGRGVHIGRGTALRCHEGTLTIGDDSIIGRHASINCYLDVEIGDCAMIADYTHVSDFDHRFDALDRPIKDQGIVKARVRIDRDTWLGTKVTVTRGVHIGAGCVVGANAVVTRDLPPLSVAAGVPARVVRNRAGER